MKASICSGLRRRSLVRSASLRSGLATIRAICSDESCAELCCAGATAELRKKTAPTAIAARRSFRLNFMAGRRPWLVRRRPCARPNWGQERQFEKGSALRREEHQRAYLDTFPRPGTGGQRVL